MAHEEKLPLELTEEILSRVPPTSLVRFTTVSKQWNALFHDKTFIKNHKITFRFILTTKSKIYLVSIDPKIEVCELTLDIPGLEISNIPKILVDCDKLLVCGMERGAVVWNPCLRQSRWIEQGSNQTQLESLGVGYNSSGSYKIVAGCRRKEGNYSNEADHVYSVYKFDYSKEHFFRFCYLPCGTTDHFMDALVLGAFEGDRFSLLKQCHATKKIEVWVSKYKINNSLNSEGVEWIMFMKVSSPNLPDLVDINYTQPSYFIEDKRLLVCSCDEAGRAWIYVFGENSLISKTHIDYVVDHWPSHCTFIPSLVSVPVKVNEKN
ncbi:PREDICTED: F-box/kelch-repeat protein At3g16580-like [Camelina sativa]|uniref:F-box/kelch-repeat protein At3g16580-like n=1 Tax=Camelina sativa TaxID=90675 RepID=A0ABM1RBS6_CAMSA|nr:PREDICTED: F-box/kelch-repeat protein At3g16580-like [Camelina sativa]